MMNPRSSSSSSPSPSSSCSCSVSRPEDGEDNQPPMKKYKHENSNPPPAAAELVVGEEEVELTSDELEWMMALGSEPSPMEEEDLAGTFTDSDSDSEENTHLRGRTREEAGEIWEQYFREIKESDGFTINTYPGGPYAYYIPRPDFKEYEEEYDMVKQMAADALSDFHDESGKRYELLDVERMVYTPGRRFYLTFTGKQLLNAPSDDHDVVVKTIQALVFLVGNDDKYPVLSCRIKP